MQALKQERTAKTVLNKGKGKGKDSHGLEQHPEPEESQPGSGGVAPESGNAGDGHEKPAESTGQNAPTAAKQSRSGDCVGGEEEGGASSRAEETIDETIASDQGQQRQGDKEERPLFSPQEAESLTAYLVESQQAFSLINVADIEHGE